MARTPAPEARPARITAVRAASRIRTAIPGVTPPKRLLGRTRTRPVDRTPGLLTLTTTLRSPPLISVPCRKLLVRVCHRRRRGGTSRLTRRTVLSPPRTYRQWPRVLGAAAPERV